MTAPPIWCTALVLAAMLTGCGTTTVTDPAAFDRASLDLSGRAVTVATVDGTLHAARAFRLEPDTTTWVDAFSGRFVSVATADIAEVRREDRALGTMRGVAVGALLGVGVGLALGATTCAEFDCADRAGAASLGVPMGLGAGVVGGGIVGALATPQRRWALAPDARRPLRTRRRR